MTVSRPVGGVLSGAGAPGWPSICAAYLGMSPPRRRRAGHPFPRLALLRVGFTEPPGSPRALVRSCRTVSPLPVTRPVSRSGPIGGLLSVALSCGSPRLASRQHPALRSPDLPRHDPPELSCRGHPAGSPSSPSMSSPTMQGAHELDVRPIRPQPAGRADGPSRLGPALSGAGARVRCRPQRLPRARGGSAGARTSPRSGLRRGPQRLWLAERGWTVTGIDYSSVGVAMAATWPADVACGSTGWSPT